MRRLAVVLCATVVLSLCLSVRVAAENSRFTIHSGELIYDNTKQSYSFSFILPAECLSRTYCCIVCQVKSNDVKKLFSFGLITNDSSEGGGGNSGGWAYILAYGPTDHFFRSGQNTVKLVCRLEKDDILPRGNQGSIRGVGVIFSDTSLRNLDRSQLDFTGAGLPPGTGGGTSYHWRKAAVHKHPTFCDGTETISENNMEIDALTKIGLLPTIDIRWYTSHYDWIANKSSIVAIFHRARNVPESESLGFENYLLACQKENIPGKRVVIGGAEIGSTWRDGKKLKHSHTLALASIHQDDELDRLVETEGSQPKIIKRLNELGWVPIAAHPLLSNYPYDKRSDQCLGLNGVEMFGDLLKNQFASTLDFALDFQKKGIFILFTSCQDTHSYLDPEQLARLKKITGVCTETLTPESVIEAVKMGRTYATRGAVFLSESNVRPEPIATRTDKAEIYLRFEGNGANGKKGQLYRDGELIEQSVIEIKDGAYRFTDETVTRGRHSYIFVVWDEFVLSPIVFQIV